MHCCLQFSAHGSDAVDLVLIAPGCERTAQKRHADDPVKVRVGHCDVNPYVAACHTSLVILQRPGRDCLENRAMHERNAMVRWSGTIRV